MPPTVPHKLDKLIYRQIVTFFKLPRASMALQIVGLFPAITFVARPPALAEISLNILWVANAHHFCCNPPGALASVSASASCVPVHASREGADGSPRRRHTGFQAARFHRSARTRLCDLPRSERPGYGERLFSSPGR